MIEAGKIYVNGRGDACGPMDERAPGVFLDQYGAVYRPDGKEWNHLEGSTANLIKELDCPHPWAAQDDIGRPYCAACGLAWRVVELPAPLRLIR